MNDVRVRFLVPGSAEASVLRLDEPLSLWGGLDPVTGEVIDRRHPQSGRCVTGSILVLPVGRGSSSASSVLLESVRLDTCPAAIATEEPDPILALGATVALELYGRAPAVVVVEGGGYDRLTEGSRWRLEKDGRLLRRE